MTQLSRASTLGIARELALGQYLAPTMAVPVLLQNPAIGSDLGF